MNHIEYLIKRAAMLLAFTAMLMLPLNGRAQNRPKIKSVDLTLPVPTPGMSLFDAREMQFTSAKTEFGDLAPTGGIRVFELDWVGDFRETDDGDMFFKDGFKYKGCLKFMVDYERFDTDYSFNGDYFIDGKRISATVNGEKAEVLTSAPYFINVEFYVNVGKGGAGSDRAMAQSAPTDYDLNKNAFRASQTAYSIAEADAVCPDVNPYDVITINDEYHPVFQAMRTGTKYEFGGHKAMLVTKVIVDTDDQRIYTQTASDVNNYIQGAYNIREVWLSDKVDAMTFILSMCGQMRFGYDDDTKIYTPDISYLFHSQRATLFIPESAVAGILARFNRPTWAYPTLYGIKVYSGDVYNAYKKGADAAKPLCVNHIYTAKVAAADKIYRYYTCCNSNEYYYSCKICGKCEHNPKHVFSETPGEQVFAHSYEIPLADDEAYIGENSAGQHVWWYSCVWCGHPEGYHQRHITKPEWKITGNEASYEYYCSAMKKMTEDREEQALLSTSESVGMFILKKKSDAKMSRAYQSSVNFALNDNLIEDDILGKDYTIPINYRQLRSLSENLIKELTLEDVKPAALGLDKVLGGTPSDDASVSRQMLAAVMYRSLRYIEERKVYSYTEYTPALEKYSDRGSIAPWAKEAMEFMEALGLMSQTSAGYISPEKECTIEEAIDLAEKCTHAHQLGWYQARCWGEGVGREYVGNVFLTENVSINHTYAPGERVWVVGPRIGVMLNYLPIIDPLTGTVEYVKAEWFRPVRKNVFTSKRTVRGPIIFADYFCGAPTGAGD